MTEPNFAESEQLQATENEPELSSNNAPDAAIEGAETKSPEKRQSTAGQERAADERRPTRIPFPTAKLKALKTPAERELAERVEKILEDGLREPYEKLSPVAKQEFKVKGEETAAKIAELLDRAKIQVKKIFRLILEWLLLLPGLNRFFLEQEAKIKTDKIFALKRQIEGKN